MYLLGVDINAGFEFLQRARCQRVNQTGLNWAWLQWATPKWNCTCTRTSHLLPLKGFAASCACSNRWWCPQTGDLFCTSAIVLLSFRWGPVQCRWVGGSDAHCVMCPSPIMPVTRVSELILCIVLNFDGSFTLLDLISRARCQGSIALGRRKYRPVIPVCCAWTAPRSRLSTQTIPTRRSRSSKCHCAPRSIITVCTN